MCHANDEKWEMTNDGSNRSTKSRKNQNAQRKGNLKYLGILEEDTIKQAEMKEKNFKNILGEQENYLKPNYIAVILSKW